MQALVVGWVVLIPLVIPMADRKTCTFGGKMSEFLFFYRGGSVVGFKVRGWSWEGFFFTLVVWKFGGGEDRVDDSVLGCS